jgi:gamma-glutamylcyclotransferase (GGCT)/AIG2-like uncharacterized protein YtfP
MVTLSVSGPVPLFVYGTLRKTGKFSFYLDEFQDTKEIIKIMNYQLMEMEGGDVYIDKVKTGHPSKGVLGELYHVTLSCLRRIQHLENASGSFPKAYELAILEGAVDKDGKPVTALYFKLKEAKPIMTGDTFERRDIMSCLEKYIDSKPPEKMSDEELVSDIHKCMNGANQS